MTRRFGAVTFEGVRVSGDRVVGRHGSAKPALERQLEMALALQCAEMVGVADRTLEFTLLYGRERFAFGRPIVSYQAIKHRVADLLVKLEGSKAVTEALAAALDSRGNDVRTLASAAKAYVAETCLTVIDECVQITGGIGVTWEHDLHLYNRRAAVDHAVFGTPEEHKRVIVQALREAA
jgi:alkylation response protein AidB-like acyl-CoA dehydrogenase